MQRSYRPFGSAISEEQHAVNVVRHHNECIQLDIGDVYGYFGPAHSMIL
jgi:hypothetical protein